MDAKRAVPMRALGATQMLLLLVTVLPFPAVAGPLFSGHEVLPVTLTAPFRQIAGDSDADPAYHSATMTLPDGRQFDLRVRARGKSRRTQEVCDFPPLRLAMKKKHVADSLFAGQKKLKLVTYCKRPSSYQQYVLREYLAYRIYNQLTDYSFRVRLLEVTYVDSEGRSKPVTRLGFVIEDRKQVAKRNGARYARVANIGRDQLEPQSASIHEVFQYMVGNTDWAAVRGPEDDKCCHNAILLTHGQKSYIPVPYDFDATGLVDPPYAAPSDKVKIRKVTQRLFRGFCGREAQVSAAIEHTLQNREAIYQLVTTQEGLSKSSISTLNRYLDKYYDVVSDQRRLQREIFDGCR